MGSSINPTLTYEFRALVNEKSDFLRDEKERLEASELQNSIQKVFKMAVELQHILKISVRT